ncbi:MAG: hypothetical protein LBM02_08835 [Lachnospiraceae bacterium]|jgi:hypothetical protein|nr:hypothetical protein [Lachnospiraceae bacterium]
MRNRKGGRKLLALVLALAMIFTMGVTYMPTLTSVKADEQSISDKAQTDATNQDTKVSAETVENDTSNNSDSSIEDSSQTDTNVEKDKETNSLSDTSSKNSDDKVVSQASKAKKSLPKAGLRGAGTTEETTREDFAKFESYDGVMTSLAGDSTFVEDTTAIMTSTTRRTLTVNASFPHDGTDKTLEIKLGKGMQLMSAPGWDANISSFNTSSLPDQLKPYVSTSTWTPDTLPNYVISHTMKNGTLIYNFKSGTESASIDIVVSYDPAFLGVATAGTEFPTTSPTVDPSSSYLISITSSYSDTTGVHNENAYLEHFVVSTHDPSAPHSGYFGAHINGQQNKYKNPGDSWTATEAVWLTGSKEVSNMYVSSGRVLFKEMQVQFKVHKKLHVTDDVLASSGSGYYPNASSNINVDITPGTGNDNYDYVTITIKADAAHPFNYGKNIVLMLKGTVDTNADSSVDGLYGVQSVLSESKITLLNGQEISSFENEYNTSYFYVNKNPTLHLGIDNGKNNVYKEDWSYSAENVFLGGFQVQNLSATDLLGYRVKMDFSDSLTKGEIGVTNVKVNIATKDVFVKTTKHPEGYLLAPSTDLDNGIISPPLDSDEYITSVEATFPTIKAALWGSGCYGVFTNRADSNYWFNWFGDFLGTPGDYSASITTYKPVDPDTAVYNNPNDWTQEDTKEQPVRLQTSTDPLALYYTTASNSGNVSLIAGGDSKTISSSFQYRNFSPSSDTVLQSFKGYTIYVREPKGYKIDPSTICFYDNYIGKTYHTFNADGTTNAYVGTDSDATDDYDYYTTSKLLDEDGNTVYTINLPNKIMGGWDSNLKKYSGVYITANIAAKATTPTSHIYFRDVFMGVANGLSEAKAVQIDTFHYYRNDDFGILGTVATASDRHLEATKSGVGLIETAANAKVVVDTAAGSGDGNYYSYDSANPNSVISLSTTQDAKYQVTLANNSGNVVNAGQTVIIPIPKKDQVPSSTFIDNGVSGIDSSATPSSYKFKWSAYLQQDVESQLEAQGYTVGDTGKLSVMYSTNYEPDKYVQGIDPTSAKSGWKTYAELINGETDPDTIKSILETVKSVEIIYNQAVPAVDPATGEAPVDKFFISLGMPQGDAANAAQGLTNYYSSNIYANYAGNTGYFLSSPVALKANTGIIKGKVYKDNDRNSVIDTTTSLPDTGLANVEVKAYKAGETHNATNLVDSTATGTDGSYQLINLQSGQNVDIVFDRSNIATTNIGFVAGLGTASTSIDTDTTWEISSVTANGTGYDSVNALLQEPYKVVFDTTGNTTGAATTNASVTTQYVYNGAKATAIADTAKPYKIGQTFEGWYYKPNDEGTFANTWTKWDFSSDVVNGTSVIADDDVDSSNVNDANTLTLRAGYSLNSYAVTYNMNGGSYLGSTVTAPADNSVNWSSTGLISTAAASVTKQGYILSGWEVTSGGNTTWNNIATKLITTGTTGNNGTIKYSDVAANDTNTGITVKAIWSPRDVAVTYVDSDGTTELGTGTGKFDGVIASATNDPTKAGYSFAGWQSEAQSGTTYWAFGSTGTKLTFANGVTEATNSTVSITLKAVYTKNIYTLNASDFSFGVSNGNISTANILKLASVYGKASATDYLEASNLAVDTTTTGYTNLLTAISDGNVEGGTNLGVYEITAKNTFNDNSTKDLKITLKDTSALSDSDYIAGNNVIIGKDEFANGTQLSATELLYRAQVVAEKIFATKDSENISRADLVVNSTDLKKVNNDLANGMDAVDNVRVKTANGTEITIKVNTRNHGGGVLGKYSNATMDEKTTNGTIGASDFALGYGYTLNENDAIANASVVAKDLYGNIDASSSFKVDEDELAAINTANAAGETGTYPLTFKRDVGGENVTVNVRLFNQGSDPSVSGAKIYANNFTYDIKNKVLNPWTKDLAKELSNVTAYDGDGNPIALSQITLTEAQFNTIKSAISSGNTGIFELTFAEPSGKTASIKVTLVNTTKKPDTDKQGGGGKTHVKDPNTGVTKVKHITKTNYIYKTITRVKTGDYNNIILMILLFLIAGGVITVVVRRKRK